MTHQAISLDPAQAQAETVRLRNFLVLLVVSAVVGGIAGVWQHALAPTVLLMWFPAYLLWIRSDLRARRVAGAAFVLQCMLAMVPGWGLLAYLLWSRRLFGIVGWLLFIPAVSFPALLTGCLTHAIAQIARCERW